MFPEACNQVTCLGKVALEALHIGTTWLATLRYRVTTCPKFVRSVSGRPGEACYNVNGLRDVSCEHGMDKGQWGRRGLILDAFWRFGSHFISHRHTRINQPTMKARSRLMIRIFFRGAVVLILALTFGGLAVSAQTAPPRVFFTDLTSGPNTGGENNNGTILTIYGRNFGATRGTSTVTVGGGQVAAYLQWGGHSKAATTAAQLETISVAIGSSAATGAVVVNTGAGTSGCEDTKDSCQFTVRAGNIRCVSAIGNDSNTGNFPSSCWKTVPYAKNSLIAGDIAYVEDGVTATTPDNYNAALAITGNNCTSSSPCALVVYPGATATIGTTSLNGARTPAVSGAKDYWTIAGFTLVGASAGLDLVAVTGWRVINNDFSCPRGNGQSACMHTDTTTQYRFYGNYVHNIGDQSGSIDKYYHGIYFTTNSNHIWAGWNESNNNPTGSTTSGGCRAIQFYSTGGANQFDLHVHDNWIHNSICDGLNFSTVDPSQGTVEAYNNVVYHVGTGPDPYNGSSNYSCVVSGGGGTGNELVYNNTFYDCGSRGTSDSGAIDPTGPSIAMWNNIIYQLGGESYVNPNASASQISSGSNNIWFGVSGAPSQTTANITTNPLFLNPGADFRLQTASPAVGAGTSARKALWDFMGGPRPIPPSIGAFELVAAGTVQQPNPPTNLTVVVN